MPPLSQRWERYGKYPYLLAKIVFWAGLVLLLFAVLFRLRVVVAPVLAGFFLAYALGPLADRLHRLGAPRWLAVVLPLTVGILLVLAVFLLLAPRLIHEMVELIGRIPAYMEEIRSHVVPFLEDSFGVQIHDLLDPKQMEATAAGHASELLQSSRWLIQTLLSSVATIVSFLFGLLLVLMVTIYLLKDYAKVISALHSLIPRPAESDARRVLQQIDQTMSAFIRGQLLVAAIIATVYSLALSILGVPFAVLIGLLGGILNMIPYAGPALGMVIALAVSALEFQGSGQLIAVAVLFVVVPVLDGLFLTPNVVGNKVGLPPVVIVLGIVAAGDQLGLIGVLLAVPTLAVGRILVLELLRVYRNSRLYLGGDRE